MKLLGLGFRGQGKAEESQKAFAKAAAMNLANPWAAYYARRRVGQSEPNQVR